MLIAPYHESDVAGILREMLIGKYYNTHRRYAKRGEFSNIDRLLEAEKYNKFPDLLAKVHDDGELDADFLTRI